MNSTLTDVVAILSAVAGLAGTGILSAFGASIDAWAPGWGTKTVSILTSLCYTAAIVVYIIKNRTGAPATSIVQGAPVVPKGTQVTTTQTQVLGTNTATPIQTLLAQQDMMHHG